MELTGGLEQGGVFVSAEADLEVDGEW